LSHQSLRKASAAHPVITGLGGLAGIAGGGTQDLQGSPRSKPGQHILDLPRFWWCILSSDAGDAVQPLQRRDGVCIPRQGPKGR